jgi:hypothetical protein
LEDITVPEIKSWSTGRIGNAYSLHPNTDHINTAGLDPDGVPGIEAYIDEDIVRAFDDNRPLLNLLSNEEQINRSLDASGRKLGINALIKNDHSDWALTIDDINTFTDAEDFSLTAVITPLRIAIGSATTPSGGYTSIGYKKLSGLKRSDGTILWIDDNSWYYSATPTLDDPISYYGYYRPIYIELPQSSLPTSYETYELTVRQLYTTGAVYTYPIFIQEDFVIPLVSSTYDISAESVTFEDGEYPYYNHYPDSYFQLTSSGLGILEISEDAVISKSLKKLQYRVLGNTFLAEAGAYSSELTEDAFRLNKTANISRIENDLNFLRVMTGIKAYNQSSRVYFNDHKDSVTSVLLPVYDNRDYLGNQQYSFEVGFYDSTEDPSWEEVGLGLMNAESEDLTQFTSTTENLGTKIDVLGEASRNVYGSYGYNFYFYNDAINCFGTKTFTAQNSAYARGYFYISSNYKVAAVLNKVRIFSLYDAAAELISLSMKTDGLSTDVSAWEVDIGGTTFTNTATFSRSNFHKVEIYFIKGSGANGGGSVWIDDVQIANKQDLDYSMYQVDKLLVGPSQAAGSTSAGSYLYVDDIKIDTSRVADYQSRYKKVYVTSPETRGYQSFGLTVANPSAAFSLSTSYAFNISVNGAAIENISVDLINSDGLYDIADKIQTELDANAQYAWARVKNNGASWDLVIYSKSSGSYSTISITPDISSDLIPALGGSYIAAVAGISDWLIYNVGTVGSHTAVRSSGGTTVNDFTGVTNCIGNQVFLSMVSAGFDNFTVGINDTTSFSHSCELYIATNSSTQGYQELNMSVPDPSTDSRLSPLTTYYFKLSIDGATAEEFSFTTTSNTSYSGILTSINSVISGHAVVSITIGNEIRFTSDSYGPGSSILTSDGTTGSSLFGAAYPAAGFTNSSLHATPVAGTGKLVSIRPRKINTFAITTDDVKERAVYSHEDGYIYVTPDTESDIRDHIDTVMAFNTNTSANRWSTHNDRVIRIDLSTHGSWTASSTIKNLFSFMIGTDTYLLVANSTGQVFYYKNGDLYTDDFVVANFLLLHTSLVSNTEKVNKFFIYDDSVNNKKFLFVLKETYILYANITSGLTASTVFTGVNTSDSGTVSNVTDVMFKNILDAESWEANVNDSTVNYYVVFVGESDKGIWEFAPILYALYDTTGFTFTWYAEEIYKKTQLDKITSITKYNGWADPEQDYQLFITTNINGAQIWTGNSQNNSVNVGGGGDDRFNRFSWIIPNNEDGADALLLDSTMTSLNFAEVYGGKIFVGGARASTSVFGGLYSYGLNKTQKYASRDADLVYADTTNDILYVTLYNDFIGNSDPAIAKISKEVDAGRAQLCSTTNLISTLNWPADASFRLLLVGFNINGLSYDGEYNITFDGQQANISDMVDAINGVIGSAGFMDARKIIAPTIPVDLTGVIRARYLTSIEKSGGSYTSFSKIVIESKTSALGEISPHTLNETTRSDCSITIRHPTVGTSIVGSGADHLEMLTETTAEANLQMVDWSGAECFQLNRVSANSLEFSGNSYVNISPHMDSGYNILTGSFRLKGGVGDEIGYSQGIGRIIDTTTILDLPVGDYSFKVMFDSGAAVGVAEVTSITCLADVANSLSGKYWLLDSPINHYYVWYNTGSSTDPAVFGRTGIQVVISTGASNQAVRDATILAIDALADFVSIAPGGPALVRVTNVATGNVLNASDWNTGFTISVSTPGSGGSVTNLVALQYAGPTFTVQDLLNTINNQISGGVASLQTIGGTAEYCDVVITSNTTGSASSVKIISANFGEYLFGKLGLDLIPNAPLQGYLTFAGSQTLGITWETADYFIEYDHPGTNQLRIYIPNGVTRLDTGATVWADFWQHKLLTKIASKTGSPLVNNIPTTGQWTFDIEQKKIVVGDQPAATDIIFADIKINKVLLKMDLGTSIPSTQEDLSDEFHSTLPRNLENSEISVARSIARINALHYGIDLLSTDLNDRIVVAYSFFLPRLDLLVAEKERDEYGNRVSLIKGVPDASSPFVEVPLNSNDEYSILYSNYINSQDYNNNNIVEAPWYNSYKLREGVIYLDGSTQYFRSSEEFISDRGLVPISRDISLDKTVENNDYVVTRITDPVGVLNYRNRNTQYNNIDASECIFLDGTSGDDADNDGTTRAKAVKTLSVALGLTTSLRPYVIIMKQTNLTEETFLSSTINKAFKVYLISEYVANVPTLTVSSECYLQGIKVTTKLLLSNGHEVTAKYCYFEQIETNTTGTYSNGISLLVYNSIINLKGLEVLGGGSLSITGAVGVLFDHVYLKGTTQLLNFNPNSYNSALANTFTFTNVSNYQGSSGNVIVCPYSTGITITIDKAVLAGDTTTYFNSAATITLSNSLTYTTQITGGGSIVSSNNQTVSVGEIDVIAATGAPESIARGYTADSFAIKYLDHVEDVGAFLENRVENNIKNKEQSTAIKTYLKLSDSRVQYRYDLAPNKISFYIRFKPTNNFQTGGVLFDSRYSGDFDSSVGTFNKNGLDFIQIVYNNKTYEKAYLDANKYCFKIITSNNSETNVSVIGPYFTATDYAEYNKWHEIAFLLTYDYTYNNKYSLADLSGTDKDRKQTVIYTIFDGEIDRVYGLKNRLFENASGVDLVNSKWYPGATLSRFFNVGGGWTGTWATVATVKQWSTWAESTFDMTVDNFMVSRDAIPINILKDFGYKKIIDLNYNDWRVGRLDDRTSGIIVHCNNADPFSDNGLHASTSSYVAFRPYEGFDEHALAIESASANLLTDGRIVSGNWFDRGPANAFVSGPIIANIWAVEPTANDNIIAVLNQNSTNLVINFVNINTQVIVASTVLVAGVTPTGVVMTTAGSLFVIAYILPDTKAYFVTVNTTTYALGVQYILNNAATDYLSIHAAHDASDAVFTYHSASKGYVKVMNVSSGAVVAAAVDYTTDATDVTYSSVVATFDKDGNDTYTIFYRIAAADTDEPNHLRYVMYSKDLLTQSFVNTTLLTTDEPIDLEAKTFTGLENIFIKWKDYNVGADSPTKCALVNKEGTIVVAPTVIFATGHTSSLTDSFKILSNSKILFASEDRTTQHLAFHLFDENITEITNSPYLREFDDSAVGRVFLCLPEGTSNYIVVTDIATYGNIISLDTAVPSRWLKDFRGTYDYFQTSVEKTDTLFGYAMYVNMNHATSAGETGVFVANGDLGDWNTVVYTNGTVTSTINPLMHGLLSYKFIFAGSGDVLYAYENNVTPGADLYARFYIEIDPAFNLLGSGTKTLEIARFGPSTDPLILSIVYNDPALGGDGKYKLAADTTSYGNEVTVVSFFNYGQSQYVDMRWVNHGANGGWEVWVDGAVIFSELGQNTSAAGNVTYISVGSKGSGSNSPAAGAILWFDDVKVGTSLVGEYTVGLSDGEMWQSASVANTNQHFLSGYYNVINGVMIIKLEGTSIDDNIQIELTDEEFTGEHRYVHTTSATDNVDFIEIYPLNYNKAAKFIIGFHPDQAGTLEVHFKTEYSDDDTAIDEFIIDNIKLEESDHPTSIITNQVGYTEYNYGLKENGSAFFRIIPEFFIGTPSLYTIFSGYAYDESNTEYITHELYYNGATQKFVFYVQDDDGNVESISSDIYGDASLATQFTDLREKHTIVCNWDISHNFIEMFIDNTRYYKATTTLVRFRSSFATTIGNKHDKSSPADCLFDLIRIGEDPLSEIEVELLTNKRDPFVHPNKTDLGVVTVKSLSFFGLNSGDLFDANIYTEANGSNWNLVIDKGSGFHDNVVIRHEGTDIVTFGSQGVTILGSLQVTNLIAETVTNMATVGDHITLRYGFSGWPKAVNDSYIEVERGNWNNSEIRWDESQRAWVFKGGYDPVLGSSMESRISIDGQSIGSWINNEDWDIDIDGTGSLRFKTGTAASGSKRAGGYERLKFSSTELVFNTGGLTNYDFRMSSDSKSHMFFLSDNIDKIIIGRVSGTATSAVGDLVVNNAITVQYSGNGQNGQVEFRNDAGTLAGYIGAGNPLAATPYWEIVSNGTNFLSMNTNIEMVSGKVIRWANDATYTNLAYTADVTTQVIANPGSFHGVYCSGNFTAYKVFNNVWNDYAECFEFDKEKEINPEPGFVYKMTERGLVRSDRIADKAAIGVYSDTYGQLMGADGLYNEETRTGNKLPIALAGKVKVWVNQKLEIGDVLVSGDGGFAVLATDEQRIYSDLIIGKVIEASKDEVEKRIWILK